MFGEVESLSYFSTQASCEMPRIGSVFFFFFFLYFTDVQIMIYTLLSACVKIKHGFFALMEHV